MKTTHLNYKLLNTLIMVIIVFFIYQMRDLWTGIVSKIFSILTPFIVAFTMAYAFYPLMRKIQSKGVPKVISLSIIVTSLVLIVVLIMWLFIPSILPILFDQTTSLFSSIITFIQDISTKFDVNLGSLKDTIANMANSITAKLGATVSNGAVNIISSSISIISNTIFTFIAFIYFLYDMEGIRKGVREYLYKKNIRTYQYVKALDKSIYNYFDGMAKYILIQLIEYPIVFYLIGHPNYLLLGILSAVTTIIPYFGSLITNIIAVITATVVSPSLLILTIILTLVLPNIDGLIISPRIFNQTNRVPALLTIFAVFAGGVLYGFIGITISLPVTIILLTTYRFFRKDISKKITQIKSKGRPKKVI